MRSGAPEHTPCPPTTPAGRRVKTDVVIIGAGIAGLACAQELRLRGLEPVVLDKARGVGGRCATWRVREQPADYGLVFLHGSDPAFLGALESLDGATPLPGWPERIRGEGAPCQPSAFRDNERRIAFAEGLTIWPKRMAERLDVRLRTRVASLEPSAGGIRLWTADGECWAGRDLVIAMPCAQTEDLLSTIPTPSPELEAARALLRMLAAVPCLALIASYASGSPEPDWDVLYPEDSGVLHLVSHDSAKRPRRSHLTLVYQCLPSWSRRHLDDPEESWTKDLLEEAGRLIGRWAARPTRTKTHRWRYARADGGSELSGPMLIPLGSGARIGLAGEVFAAGGGAQAAWLSGRRLARRLLGMEEE